MRLSLGGGQERKMTMEKGAEGRRKEEDRERGEKGARDRAFLVASIHVSSVTRVMSVGNTRFLESNGALFSLFLTLSAPPPPSYSLRVFISPAHSFCQENFSALFIMAPYVHTCTENKARVFGTTSTYHGTYLRTGRCSSYLAYGST